MKYVSLEKYLAFVFFLLPLQATWQLTVVQIGFFQANPTIAKTLSQYLTVSLYAVDVMLLVGVVWAAWRLRWRLSNTAGVVVASMLVFTAINIVAALYPLVSFWKWLTLWLIALFCVAVYQYANRKWLVVSVVAAAVLQAGFGLWQFVTQTIHASTLLGVAAQSPDVAGASVVALVDGRWLRAYGSFPHPNIYGGFLAIGLLFAVAQYFLAYERFQKWWDSIGVTKNPFELLREQTIHRTGAMVAALLASMSIIVGGLFVSFSRGAVLAATAGLVVLFVGKYYRNKVRFTVLGTKVVLTILATVAAFSLVTPPLWTHRVTESSRLETRSHIERIDGYSEAASVLPGNLVFGTGLQNYTAALSERWPGKPAYAYQPVHNVWLLLFVELGIVGVLLLLYLFGWHGRWLLPTTAVGWGFAAAVLFIMLTDHYLWSLHAGTVFWLYIFFGIQMYTKEDSA